MLHQWYQLIHNKIGKNKVAKKKKIKHTYLITTELVLNQNKIWHKKFTGCLQTATMTGLKKVEAWEREKKSRCFWSDRSLWGENFWPCVISYSMQNFFVPSTDHLHFHNIGKSSTWNPRVCRKKIWFGFWGVQKKAYCEPGWTMGLKYCAIINNCPSFLG